HERVSTRTETNANIIVNVSPSVIWAKKMMMLAMSSPRTHFVIALRHSIGQHRLRHFHESADVRPVDVVHEALRARSVRHAGVVNTEHDILEPVVDLLAGPGQPHAVLGLLETRDGDAA